MGSISLSFARVVYGLAVLIYGATAFVWHDFTDWPQAKVLGNTSFAYVFLCATAVVQLIGGLAVLRRMTMKLGAILLGTTYLVFALLCLPRILATPLVYDAWGNIFEQLALFCGALFIYASALPLEAQWRRSALCLGAILFGICVLSFALERAFYFQATSGLVPKWIFPSQTFWAIVTTIAFVAAAIAIITGWRKTLAAQLLAVMLLLFAVLVWLPILLAKPRLHFNWTETAETLAIAAVAWMQAQEPGKPSRVNENSAALASPN